jgi:cell wall-associated NlpC family hydrolase
MRSGKYSSDGKRERSSHKPDNVPAYTHNSKKEETKSKTKISNISKTRKDIISTAMAYMGTSYRSGGKSPESGFDCSGFAGYVFTQNGIPISGSSDMIAKMGKEKDRSDLQPGDLIFFGNADRISHVAIVSDNEDNQLKVIHATTSSGVKTDLISNYEYWESRYLFAKDILSK